MQKQFFFTNLLCTATSFISPEDPCVRSHTGHTGGVQLLPAGAQRGCGDEGKGTDEDVLAARRGRLRQCLKTD